MADWPEMRWRRKVKRPRLQSCDQLIRAVLKAPPPSVVGDWGQQGEFLISQSLEEVSQLGYFFYQEALHQISVTSVE